MQNRYVAIWFCRLLTDWYLRRHPGLKEKPFAFAVAEKGRRIVKAANNAARERGVYREMALADCRAIVPDLEVVDYDPARAPKLLHALAEWCIRFTPVVAVDPPDGLILDATGCTHLWGSERGYVNDLLKRFKTFGYEVQIGMADTIGTAWAVSRFGDSITIVPSGSDANAIAPLPPAALRLDGMQIEKLEKLGLNSIGSFMRMPSSALRRRFGPSLLTRLGQALGEEIEIPEPIHPVTPYQERLPCLEPIRNAGGIEIALNTLLEGLCSRLARESKGLRKCQLLCHRVDGNIQKIDIATSRPSRNPQHLMKLFENKIAMIEPDLGIELFILDASVVEDLTGEQEALWSVGSDKQKAVAELLDRVAGRTGAESIKRFLPAEHYWPERSVKIATTLTEQASATWRPEVPRPIHLLENPEQIEVTVPMPDYPPMLFRHKGVLHTVAKADGPERIEQEWWLQAGLFRDYYCVEDTGGRRFWIFRAGSYEDVTEPGWYLHGYFT